MWHKLRSRLHVSIASLVRLLLAMVLRIWYRGCVPGRPDFALFASLGYIGNNMSPWGKGPGNK